MGDKDHSNRRFPLGREKSRAQAASLWNRDSVSRERDRPGLSQVAIASNYPRTQDIRQERRLKPDKRVLLSTPQSSLNDALPTVGFRINFRKTRWVILAQPTLTLDAMGN